MSNDAAGVLVYVRGVGDRVEPQKCERRPVSLGSDYWKSRVVMAVALTPEEYALPLDELARKYPAPAVKE